ncbi:MAG: hypothetical protein LAO20_07795 [Acidobacteriia bacterium]|nr:hypothetical protein [Terriglobia bacterium]
MNEGLGRTSDQHRWVYVSDGGHFENLGLYEMVMRRCKRIIVVDGSADPGFNLDDLGGAMRKIQIDLGIPIEFRPLASFKPRPDKSDRHWFLGKVQYSAVDGTAVEDGQLIYIKASLTGDEPEDVTQYAKTHSDFPHESTANQFFDESQFQGYVRLGEHVVERMVKDTIGANLLRPVSTEELFNAAGGKQGNP